MSTKIYHGYRTSITSLPVLWERLSAFGTLATKLMERQVTRVIAATVAQVIDNATLKLPQPDWLEAESAPLSAATEYVLNAHRDVYKTRHRNPEFDFGCRVLLYPSRLGTLMTFDAEHDGYHRLWKDVCAFQAFPYWNNTDRPNGIGQRAWDRRGDRWNSALRAPVPLSFVAIGDWIWFVPRKQQVLRSLPSVSARVSAAAHCIVRGRRLAKRLKGTHSTQDFMRELTDHRKWLGTPAGVKALRRQQSVVSRRLLTIDEGVLTENLRGGGK